MRKTGAMLASFILLMSLLPAATMAKSSSLRVEVDGGRIYFPDEQPYLDQAQRVQVPVRFVSEALGAKVGWDAATKTVTIELEDNRITLVLGNKEYLLNGESKQMDKAAARVGGRTFVPLRFVSEGLGTEVNWDSTVRTVRAYTPGFDPSEVKLGAEQIVEESIYGFKVKQNTGSGLHITRESYEPNSTRNYALIDLLINYPFKGNDYEKQIQEVEEILIQKIDEEIVNSIMKYVKTKTSREPELKTKIYTDETYKIYVGSNINSGISITVFYK
ncbi:copper amine oxidase N-terminal domain-containing protein [Paenibacillus bouchesdurhonensis]|uniref:copper amine oxidase N-terminal domain-containing protein n=1 Tax=Paenibacillus bouchesdurhonensis TaxID=1870990 RepID=UPI001901943B|nr:copper amine oxidase N-terminal domain-containing protein [Paenibacillus bouchesdurhonensis]